MPDTGTYGGRGQEPAARTAIGTRNRGRRMPGPARRRPYKCVARRTSGGPTLRRMRSGGVRVMTGPEHYREAEKDIERACNADEHYDRRLAALFLGRAQVHAILA